MRALTSRLGRLLREPLVQFLLLGAGLFLLYRVVSPEPEAPPNRIVVEAKQVARLAQQFQRTWLRPPTGAELDGLIEEHVTEEVLYREALALGLEKDDPVIRRRLRLKMDFLDEDLGAQREPTEAELQAYLDAHPAKFAAPPRTGFRQVYLRPERDRSTARARAEALRARLDAGAVRAEEAGDGTLLPRALENASAREIALTFGAPFAAALEALLPGPRWRGPIETEYGLHLVEVTARDPGGPQRLAAVRTAVAREWSAQQREQAKAKFYATLRARYEVSIERAAERETAALMK